MNYKLNFYNILIPIKEKNIFLLFNTLNEGLCELDQPTGRFLEELINSKSTIDYSRIESPLKEEIDKLIENQYIIDTATDEKSLFYNNYKEFRKRQNSESGALTFTIVPTLSCNLSCRYCFQTRYNGRTMTFETADAILKFIDTELEEQKYSKNYKKVSVSWFGGEPLINLKIIEYFSNKVIDICDKRGVEYRAQIVTNGTLIKPEYWKKFEDFHIKEVQVTVDGIKEIHDVKRPFTNKSDSSFDCIINNLKTLPEDSKLEIYLRINCDRRVEEKLDDYLDTLEANNIWPQRRKQFTLDLAKTNVYDCIQKKDEENVYFSHIEFFEVERMFRHKKLKKYNEWASKVNAKPGKLSFKLPSVVFYDCTSATSPTGFVLDPEGYIHKCWELVDNSARRIQHISEELNFDDPKFKFWLDFDKAYTKAECKDCEYLPICGVRCPLRSLDDSVNFTCSRWKYTLEKEIKEQYLLSIDQPEKIGPITKIFAGGSVG